MREAVRNQSHAGAQGAHGRVLTCEEETARREPAGREHLHQGLEPFSGAAPVEKLGTGSHAEGPHLQWGVVRPLWGLSSRCCAPGAGGGVAFTQGD